MGRIFIYNHSVNSEKGNVLFLILIAVALFAALSYAVGTSTRGSGKNTNEEKLKTGAAAIQNYVASVRSAVQRLMLSNDCTVQNLDWRNTYWKRLDGSPSVGILHAPISPKSGCAIFTSQGGPISDSIDFGAYGDKVHNSLPDTWRIKAGHATPVWVNRKNEGSAANDIAIIIRGMDNAMCSYLLDPVTRPDGVIESYADISDANLEDNATWTGPNDIIDEPENLNGDFFANFNVLATGSGCDVGAIVVTR